jgi:pimeloyl-ACP methyl ester carboxylesterase
MTTPETASFTLDLPGGRTVRGALHLPAGEPPFRPVVICHGFKGFMDWAFFPHLAELVAARGFAAVRFNFSGAGVLPGEERVSDLDAFRDDTYSREVEELEAVLAAITGGASSGLGDRRVTPERIGLVGHSRGGGVALLAAAGERFRGRIGALVTWNAIGEVDRFTPEQKEIWRQDGEIEVVNSRTGQRLAMGVSLLDDLAENRAALDLAAAAGRRAAPWLIVHGEADETVPVAEGRRLHAAAAPPAELVTIPGGGHTFGAVHPFAGPTPALIQAMNATQRWLRQRLR